MNTHSDNDFSRDNQQERLKTESWIVGFVDGEGCFSVSIFKNPTTKSGWQVLPEFVVTQGEKSLIALEEIQKYFECGRIFINKRYDNHHEHLYRYCVRRLRDIQEKIIPFFKENPLRTAKKKDFEKFVNAIQLINKKAHLTEDGLELLKQIKRS